MIRKLIAVSLLACVGLITAGLAYVSASLPIMPVTELVSHTVEISMFVIALGSAIVLTVLAISLLHPAPERKPTVSPSYPYVLWSDEADVGTDAMFAQHRSRGPPAPA